MRLLSELARIEREERRRMDPNANLAEQERILHRKFIRASHPGDLQRLRELREALAGWIRGGGFDPDWTAAPNARKYFDR